MGFLRRMSRNASPSTNPSGSPQSSPRLDASGSRKEKRVGVTDVVMEKGVESRTSWHSCGNHTADGRHVSPRGLLSHSGKHGGSSFLSASSTEPRKRKMSLQDAALAMPSSMPGSPEAPSDALSTVSSHTSHARPHHKSLDGSALGSPRFLEPPPRQGRKPSFVVIPSPCASPTAASETGTVPASRGLRESWCQTSALELMGDSFFKGRSSVRTSDGRKGSMELRISQLEAALAAVTHERDALTRVCADKNAVIELQRAVISRMPFRAAEESAGMSNRVPFETKEDHFSPRLVESGTSNRIENGANANPEDDIPPKIDVEGCFINDAKSDSDDESTASVTSPLQNYSFSSVGAPASLHPSFAGNMLRKTSLYESSGCRFAVHFASLDIAEHRFQLAGEAAPPVSPASRGSPCSVLDSTQAAHEVASPAPTPREPESVSNVPSSHRLAFHIRPHPEISVA
ncbi:hypothetical protein DIPPA_26164 [Diplonema papillatum]|nr:hypothetical protein DIPPA_26164 [Diplonema papillatum]